MYSDVVRENGLTYLRFYESSDALYSERLQATIESCKETKAWREPEGCDIVTTTHMPLRVNSGSLPMAVILNTMDGVPLDVYARELRSEFELAQLLTQFCLFIGGAHNRVVRNVEWSIRSVYLVEATNTLLLPALPFEGLVSDLPKMLGFFGDLADVVAASPIRSTALAMSFVRFSQGIEAKRFNDLTSYLQGVANRYIVGEEFEGPVAWQAVGATTPVDYGDDLSSDCTAEPTTVSDGNQAECVEDDGFEDEAALVDGRDSEDELADEGVASQEPEPNPENSEEDNQSIEEDDFDEELTCQEADLAAGAEAPEVQRAPDDSLADLISRLETQLGVEIGGRMNADVEVTFGSVSGVAAEAVRDDEGEDSPVADCEDANLNEPSYDNAESYADVTPSSDYDGDPEHAGADDDSYCEDPAPYRQVRLVQIDSGRSAVINPGENFVVGKSKYSTFQVLDTRTVSRSHATFTATPEGECWVEDNDSLNGTYVDNQRIASRQQVQVFPQQTIRMSDVMFRIEID